MHICDIHHMQDGNTALELTKDADTFECLVAAGAKMPDITDTNKNELLLKYAYKGAALLLRAVLQAGANAAHTDKVRVRAWFERNTSGWCARLRAHVYFRYIYRPCTPISHSTAPSEFSNLGLRGRLLSRPPWFLSHLYYIHGCLLCVYSLRFTCSFPFDYGCAYLDICICILVSYDIDMY